MLLVQGISCIALQVSQAMHRMLHLTQFHAQVQARSYLQQQQEAVRDEQAGRGSAEVQAAEAAAFQELLTESRLLLTGLQPSPLETAAGRSS